MKMAKIFCLVLAVAMLFSVAACGGSGNNGDNSGSQGGNTADPNKGVRLDENGNLLYKPEDVGELDNPIVHGIIAPPPDDEWYAQEIAWREDAYDLEYDYETAPWDEREMKWVSAYVSGTAYDVLTYINYPTTIAKGLLQPLDDILPINDERYFNKEWEWGGKTYAVNPIAVIPEGESFYDIGELYGVWFNKDMFDDAGLTDPVTLWEEGNWTFETFYEASKALTQDTDRDGRIDIGGWGTHVYEMFTIANGARTVTFGGEKLIELTWNSPEYIEGLEWFNKCKEYGQSTDAGNKFRAGTIAMYIERCQCARGFTENPLSFEADWVPFPKGPSGEGYKGSLSTGTWTVGIGEGAKNIEGAKVFICADIARYDYVPLEGSTKMIGVTDEMIERAKTCEDKMNNDHYSGVGSISSKMWTVWGAIAKDGAKATIEKYTPVLQKEIDNLLATEKVPEPVEYKSPGTVDFEDGNVVLKEKFAGTVTITEDASEVINGSKSLKIQLAADNDYGPVAVTTADNYGLPYGSSVKATMKVKAVGGTAQANSFVVQFRPSAALETGDDSVALGGYNPVDLSDGQVHEVEVLINIMDNYNDLQMFIIANTDETAPELAIIIDDLTIAKVEA